MYPDSPYMQGWEAYMNDDHHNPYEDEYDKEDWDKGWRNAYDYCNFI